MAFHFSGLICHKLLNQFFIFPLPTEVGSFAPSPRSLFSPLKEQCFFGGNENSSGFWLISFDILINLLCPYTPTTMDRPASTFLGVLASDYNAMYFIE